MDRSLMRQAMDANAAAVLLGDRAACAHYLQEASAAAISGVYLTDLSNAGTAICGAPVLGGVRDLAEQGLAKTAGPLILVGQGAAPELARMALRVSGTAPVFTTADGPIRLLRIDDFFVKPEPAPELAAPFIAGKRVLITGAGGSIGEHISRFVAALAPESVTLLENSEFNLFEIDCALAETADAPPRTLALCDIRDRAAVQRWFDRVRPEVVIHAAAYKHVPLLEAHPSEAALTNIGGAKNIIDAAVGAGAHLVFVSTDKAVDPANVMGATKRMGELYCQALDAAGGASRCVVVRLGNVLGSAGSVTPIFDRQIAAGKPITITHPDIERFFISIEQAASFILNAGATAVQREDLRGAVFVLDMGAPIRIADLARDMILLAGKRPEVDIPVRFIGLRPGEKLNERLLGDHECIAETLPHDLRAVQSPGADPARIEADIARILARARQGADDAVRAALVAASSVAMVSGGMTADAV